MTLSQAKKMIRLKDNRMIASPCLVADTIWTRMKGLLGRESLETGSGMLIEPCNSIHTFFMKFSIDAVYLEKESRNYKVVSIRRDRKPWRMDFPNFNATAVLELPAGAAGDLAEGDLLCLS
jgi:uncharacterized membrane protein (UPF0127 family)